VIGKRFVGDKAAVPIRKSKCKIFNRLPSGWRRSIGGTASY
jgi:hypothetical protein